MSEPMVVWMARDADESLWCYSMKPKWFALGQGFMNVPGGSVGSIPNSWLPDLRPGECRRMRLVDAPETGEAP